MSLSWELAIDLNPRQDANTAMIESPSRQRISCRLIIASMLATLVSSCSTPTILKPIVKGLPRLADKYYISYDNDQFGYRKWLPKKARPETVLIGIHGISGHSGDYENIGKHLVKHHPRVAMYAPETRGQGMDPNIDRRGDIYRPKEWYKDLYTFTRLIRKLHPDSKIIWFGESMGSLIVMNAYSSAPLSEKKPDAMILSSPIVDIESRLPIWKMIAVRAASALMPKLRLSLETLSNGERPIVTKDDIHEQQAAINPWYIPRYTVRLLISLGDMAEVMAQKATQVQCPVLVLHGGKDIFTEEKSVQRFYQHFPKNAKKTKKYYPGSYHLLMYDHDRDKIFNDISKWLNKLK